MKGGRKLSVRRQRLIYIIADFISTMVAIMLFNIYRYYGLNLQAAETLSLVEFVTLPKLIFEDIFIPFSLLAVYWLSGFYNQPYGKSRLQELVITGITAIVSTLLIYFAILINDPVAMRSRSYEIIIVLFVILFCFTYVTRYAITQHTINKFYNHLWSFRTIMVGNSRIARQKAFELSKTRSRLGFEVIGFVDIPGERSVSDNATIFKIDELSEKCKKLQIDQIVVAPEHHDDATIMNLLNTLYPLDIPIKIWPDTLSYITQGIRLTDIFGEPFVDLTTPDITEATRNIKRTLDVIVSIIALIVLSPLFLILAILIKRNSAGPVFYKQERIGLHRKKFNIIKFRTMVNDAEKNGPALSSVDDNRITTIGKILRKYRLDELPQFWNVLIGEMSLVGPRPEREFYIEQIKRQAPWISLIHQVRPGITSWGMVKFGYANTIEQMILRSRYDLIYLANMSITVDIKILIYTIKTVVTGKGL